MRTLMAIWVVLSLTGGAAAGPVETADYAAEITRWRQARQARLEAVGGWLSLAGLFWLQGGKNTFGTAVDADVRLPEGSAPGHAGTFEFDPAGPTVTVVAEPEAGIRLDGQVVTRRELAPDTSGAPDVLDLAPRLTLHVIERNGRYGIRLKDTEAPTRTAFHGLRWYPVRPEYRIEARWVAFEAPRMLRVPDVLGQVLDQPSPGYAEFELGGQTVRLQPVDEGGEELFFIFRDATSGHGTYGAGRFLYAAPPRDGRIVLDFNKAYNPPCAFTAFATCPLPPEPNRLTQPIEAGELDYGGH